jgi:hypothetical protein
MTNISIFLFSLLIAGCTSKGTISHETTLPKPFVIGTYGSPPHKGDTILYDDLISQLKDLHCNTYNWLIMPNEKSFEQFKEFLPLAKRDSINVWATLIPPVELEAMAVGQYSTDDMHVWAADLAKLSVTYPNFKAWSIDDFTHSLKLYTTQYVSEFQTAAKKINPDFKFYPVCYFKSTNQTFVARYGLSIDGIIFPYRNESIKMDLTDYSHASDEINTLRNFLGRSFPVFLDVYSSGHSKLGEPTMEFISNVIQSGIQNADGIIIYRHPNPKFDAEKYQTVKATIIKGLAEKK